MNIFISYTLRDNCLTLSDFQKILELLPSHNVFIHFLNPKITSHEEIKEKIIQSDLMLLIKTPATYQSEWVISELKIANNAKVPIFLIHHDALRSVI